MRIRVGRQKLFAVVLATVFLTPVISWGQSQRAGLGSWQNPDIGLVYDLRFDLHDAERDADGNTEWTTRGFRLSSAELSVGAAIDPYARLDFNAFFSEEGAEIHELFALFPSLPLNLKLKLGQYLANFGRWNQFHTHSMPFSTEPRVMNEYFDGHLMLDGLETSWLVPIPIYTELTGGVYNGIEGHTHDALPTAEESEWGPDNPPPGCHIHDGEIHCPGNPELEEEYRATVEDPDAPVQGKTNKGVDDLAYLLRLKTSIDLGLSWGVDMGVSGIHQPNYAYSQRVPGKTYSKTGFGADITVFWTPPEANLYRNMDFGVEYFANNEEFEVKRGEQIFQQTLTRDGAFGYARFRLNRRWQFGVFGEVFEPRNGPNVEQKRYGGFLTMNISHYQYITVEFSRYEATPTADPLHMIVFQYDGVIGYHTHGSQR
ncbi:MAG: hypothetical protein JSW50_09130 [Candidatus Latescibacterota bacterium]|nr:MAG: hypothetical protein JSW50_09130 [Candidatus Latescibacterota bacterium]